LINHGEHREHRGHREKDFFKPQINTDLKTKDLLCYLCSSVFICGSNFYIFNASQGTNDENHF